MQVTVPFGSTRGTVSVPWYASATFALLAVVAGIVMFGDPDMAHNVAPIGILAGDIVAGIIFIRRAMGLERRERRAWMLVGIGLIIAATGIVVLAIQLGVFGDAPTFGFCSSSAGTPSFSSVSRRSRTLPVTRFSVPGWRSMGLSVRYPSARLFGSWFLTESLSVSKMRPSVIGSSDRCIR